jgi:hypothetical protein
MSKPLSSAIRLRLRPAIHLFGTIRLFPAVAALFLSAACLGQGPHLVVPKYIRFPFDTVQSARLVSCLDCFLDHVPGPNKDNAAVQAAYLPETSALLDEMKGAGDAGSTKRNAYKCYLTNVDILDSSDYIIQLSYLGVSDSMAVLKASFKLIAYREGDQYYFRSPLRRNTAVWHKRTIGSFTFHYTNPPDDAILTTYVKKAGDFDKRLGAREYKTEYYCCNTVQEGLQALGVDYKLDYNGYYTTVLSSFEDNVGLYIVGAGSSDPEVFDIHDLWHNRLHNVIPVSTINRPIDEGCAYLYGGSWGFTWEEIFSKFKAFMGDNKDWLTAFNDNKNFGPNQRYHLYVDYVIDALVVKKIEKEKGFDAVKDFLSCGKSQPGNANYFAALDRIAGINSANFNASIERLVEDEK